MELRTSFFTVITPTYNRAHTLKRTFESLLNQKYQNFEWIIGDDGSTDGTESLVETFQERANFEIRYYKYKHRGKALTLEDTYNEAGGKYIIFLDSDDELYDESTLLNICNKINNLDSNIKFWGICGCFTDQHNSIISKFDEPYIDINKGNYFDFWINNPTLVNICWVFKRGLFKFEVPNLKEQLPYYPEVLFFMKNAAESEDFCFRLFNEPIYRYYTFNDDSVSVNSRKYPMRWYQTVGIINLFYKHQLHKKYYQYVHKEISALATNIYLEKSFKETYDALTNINAKVLFALLWGVQQIFSVRNTPDRKHKVITIFGIKIKIKRKEKNNF